MSKLTVLFFFVSAIFWFGHFAVDAGDSIPWWDDFPTIIQVSDAKRAAESNASVVLSGVADDPCWGTFQQRQRMVHNKNDLDQMHVNGQKVMTWFEGFGTAQSNVAEFRKNPDGTWVKMSQDQSLSAVFNSHWSWQNFKGVGEIRWIGIPNYFDADDFVAPWTRLHPDFGCPPMIYPDGAIAQGYDGSPSDPRNSRIWDAGCSKNVLGNVTFEYSFNDIVNKLDPNTRQLTGPLDGLVKTEEEHLGVPDPGFTPEEWKKLKSNNYAGVVAAGKDSGCPVWMEYLKASLKDALTADIDGLWVDNYSPWDSFNATPVLKAFGEWSVAGFRSFLQKSLTPEQLREHQITDLAEFDVRLYLQKKCREFGGDPTRLSDPHWRDSRWQNDLIWRAYLVYKRQLGTAAFENYYATVKRIASEAGKPDFFVSGNDIPIYSLGWIRGELDMVSTELTWGWHLTTGPRGIMPPPLGSYVFVAKLGREHAKSRFVNAWYYVPREQEEKPNIARVINYQGLANHLLPMPQYSSHTLGNPEVNSAFFQFIREIRPIVRERVPYDEQVGLFYSSSTQVMEMLPGGFRDHNNQPHSFSYYGWGTILSQLHYGWRAIPQWKLTEENLAPLKVLIIPNATVFDRKQLPILEKWVENGGKLVISGDFATRHDEDRLFDVASEPLPEPFVADKADSIPLGQGTVFFLKKDPGYNYYMLAGERFQELDTMKPRLREMFEPELWRLHAPDVPPQVGITLYWDSSKLFIDLNNTGIDTNSDTITPTGEIVFDVEIPEFLHQEQWDLLILSPDQTPIVEMERLGNNRVRFKAGSFDVYACLVLGK